MAYKLTAIFFATHFWEIEGNELFFTDFMKCFNNENPVLISTDELDPDYSNSNRKSTTALIRYTTNKDEEQVADQLQKLQDLGDLTMAVFIDNGHQKLLDLLINDLQLLNKGLTGLISELDATTGLNLTLRLDSRLYIYRSKGQTISLKEMYALNGKNKVQAVGTWAGNTGLNVPKKGIWERRTNMEGMLIRVATISYPHLHKLHYDISKKSIIGGSGLFFEPLNILVKELNLTLMLMPSNDGHYGALNKNGTWNGLVGMLLNEQADIAVASLSVTESRGRAVTFGRVITEQEVTIVSGPNKEPEADPWIYIEILPHTAWYVTFAMVVGISLCFAIINHSGINYLHDKFDSEKFTVLNGLGLSLTFFRQMYYDVNINCKSTRILFIFSAVSTYLLYVHYTAYLTASSTYVKKTQINSFRDIMSGGYQVSVMEHTAQHDLLRYSKPGTAMNEVYHKTMKNRPHAFPQSFTEVPTLLASKKTLFYAGNLEVKVQYEYLTFLRIQVM